MPTMLVRQELEVLEMIDGTREWESGAWVNACLEILRGNGYVTQYIGAKPELTIRGRAALASEQKP